MILLLPTPGNKTCTMNPRCAVGIIALLMMLIAPCTVRSQPSRNGGDYGPALAQTEPQVRFRMFAAPRRVAVMLIGDSLSFGPFGERLEALLKESTGTRGVCVFASCGSSPESWTDGEPVYATTCGYRQVTPNPREYMFVDFDHGRKPPPTATPKLGRILANYRPDLVIIQLGTNWMDGFNPRRTEDYRQLGIYIRGMIGEIRSRSPGSRIVWILPPSASRYSQTVQNQIAAYMRNCAAAFDFQTIDSRRLTGSYILGVTGSDGVHYSAGSATSWADKVFLKLKAMAPDLIAGPSHG
jgi:hypothetical protein